MGAATQELCSPRLLYQKMIDNDVADLTALAADKGMRGFFWIS